VEPAELAGLGLTLAASIALFAIGGNWLDGKLGTSPVFVLVGTFLGFAGGFYSLYEKLVLRPRRERREEDRE
jgi:F0F1-type ATP synthase assembly protein I